ncbi:dynamin family protein [Streptomyces sp. NPDC101206]|uniref:dynamin family protein n=1 Tax=Streptomyces sp. NPDC101206 TaxID=3366128 RepID=UPI0037F8467B
MTDTSDTFEALREDVTGLCQDLLARAEADAAPHTAGRLAETVDRLAEGRLTAVVCGEFNRGKSTLLNALLERTDDLLPTALYPKTRLVTTVEWGEHEEYLVRLTAADGTVTERRITRAEIDDYVGETVHGPAGPAASAPDAPVTVHIRLPHPRLRSGLVLVDTPGVGGRYPAHAKITHAAVQDADALVFVCDVLDPLTDPELAFLASAGTALRAADSEDALLVVVNKTDQDPEHEDFAHEMRRRVARYTGRTPAATPVHPVSAHARIDHLRTGDRAFLRASGMPAFEDALWRTLAARRVRVLLGAPLHEARTAAQALLAPLTAQEQALRDTTGRELERLAAEAAARQQRLDRLAAEGADWRDRAAARLEELRAELARRLSAAFDGIWERADAELDRQERFLTDPELLEEHLDNECLLAVGTLDTWAARQATGTVQDLAAETGLSLTAPALAAPARGPVVELPSYRRLRPKKRKVHREGPAHTEVVGHHWENASGGRAGPVRTAVAGFARGFGSSFGNRVADRLGVRYVAETATVRGPGHTTVEYRPVPAGRLAERRRELRAELTRQRIRAEKAVAAGTASRIEEFSAAVTAEMEGLIAREQETLAATLPRLAEARRATREEALARLAELADAQAPLRAARQAADRLLDETAALAGETRTARGTDRPGDGGDEEKPR